jgi:CubicO group peptidase (beta-lactamase class C family)
MRTIRTALFTLLALACLITNPGSLAKTGQQPPENMTAKAPDTEAGRRFSAWLQALNSGDLKNLKAFHTASGAGDRVDRRAQQDFGFYRQTRGLQLRKVVQSSEHEIVALVQAELTEAWFQASITVAAQPPHPVSSISIRRATNPSPVRVSEAEAVKVLEAYLKKLVAADAFSGTVLVAKNGKPIFTNAYGTANFAYGVPNRIDTKFNLGSMNKMFTAVAICQLAEQGKLAFNDPIGKHLTDYPNKSVAEKVTIHHLLTHTSGIGDYFNEKFMEASRDKFRSIKDYFPLFVDKPLEFEPGARFRYSNAGFMVLGAVVQKVSGKDYFDYVREHLYKPAGMINTDAYELDRDIPNLAYGYTRDGLGDDFEGGARRNNLFMHVIKGGPAGGGYSTVEDLLRFDIALRQNKFFSAAQRDILISGKVDAMGGKYAYGFMDHTINGKRIVGHGGGFPGINSQLDIYLDNGYTVAVMSNYDPPAAQNVAGKLREILTQF